MIRIWADFLQLLPGNGIKRLENDKSAIPPDFIECPEAYPGVLPYGGTRISKGFFERLLYDF